MRVAQSGQRFQDWFTQQWAIMWGKKISPEAVPWLMGPFGQIGGIADRFIEQLATDENLIIERNTTSQGLIPDFSVLNLTDKNHSSVAKPIIDFYEHTACYNLKLSVRWNPFFKLFGKLTNVLFSRRIEQLNIPLNNTEHADDIKSEIITLRNPSTGNIKYIVWYRTLISTGQVVYSGIYSTCVLPSGQTCVKAVFPLPKGNATVIMNPSVGVDGQLQLMSSGKKIGDAGFYFLLNDANGGYWAQFIRSFRDELTVYCVDDKLLAKQTLTLWGWSVVQFNYEIYKKTS